MGFYDDAQESDERTREGQEHLARLEREIAEKKADVVRGAWQIVVEAGYTTLPIYVGASAHDGPFHRSGDGWITTVHMDGGWVMVAIDTFGRCAQADISRPLERARKRSLAGDPNRGNPYEGVPYDSGEYILTGPLLDGGKAPDYVLESDFRNTFANVVTGGPQGLPGRIQDEPWSDK